MPRPSDIPADVWEAAMRAQNDALDQSKADGFAVAEYPFASGGAKEVLDLHIARAILAERERAAKVCDGAANEADDRLNCTGSVVSRLNYASAHVTCTRLAAAIRSGK